MNSIIPAILGELQSQYALVFSEVIQLQDADGNHHNFYVATINDANVLFDEDGQLWMRKPDIAKAMKISQQALDVALARVMESDLGGAICDNNNLLYPNQRGQLRLTEFYDEETIAAVITRGRNQSPEALEFLAQRKVIIKAFRKMLYEYSLHTVDQNFQLAAKLENLSAALSNEQREKRQLEWRLEEYELEQERKNRDNLDLYDYNEM